MRPFLKTGLISCMLLAALAGSSLARDAAFMDPGNSGGGDEAVRVEPKGNIDTGESTLGVAKRITIFFVNQTGFPVQIEKVAVNGDGNVAAELSNDDCTKQGTLGPQSRCSVEASITPTSAGAWSVDILMTHNGAGRIARGQLSGKTLAAGEEKKENGLSFSGKEASPVNFGEVTADGGKAVRSALMVNDSTDPITIYSIDVVEADNGLKRLEKGCAVNMQLKPGESCPVTLLWAPNDTGQISTDLIIRHSGRLGFSVIPIRGKTIGGTLASRGERLSSAIRDDVSFIPSKASTRDAMIPPPPSAPEIEKSVERVTSSSLAPSDEGLRLIGTVGNRGIFLRSDGTTTVAGINETIDTGNGGDKGIMVIAINAKSAEIVVGDKKKTLHLQASPELISKASSASRSRAAAVSYSPAAAPSSSSTNSDFVPASTPPASPPAPPSTVPTTPPPATTGGGTGGTGATK